MADTLEQIWGIGPDNDFIIALDAHVAEKCGYGEALDALSGPERVFYTAQRCEEEVNNGGFSQYFFNTGGSMAGELVRVFTEIGARHTAEICGRALEAVGTLPEDADGWQALMDDLSEEAEAELEACSDAFFRYEDDLNALNRAYVLEHRAEFT